MTKGDKEFMEPSVMTIVNSMMKIEFHLAHLSNLRHDKKCSIITQLVNLKCKCPVKVHSKQSQIFRLSKSVKI